MLSVKALMSQTPMTIGPEDSLQDALAAMNNGAGRELSVVESGDLVGIVTDRDLRLAVNSPLLEEHDIATRAILLRQTPVSACMTTEVVTTTSGTPAVEAAQALKLNRISAMPVLHEGARWG